MLDSKFWSSALERAIKTFAQTLVALMGAGAVDVLTVDWTQAMSVAGGAALMSLLTSIASNNMGSTTGPSLVGEGK